MLLSPASREQDRLRDPGKKSINRRSYVRTRYEWRQFLCSGRQYVYVLATFRPFSCLGKLFVAEIPKVKFLRNSLFCRKESFNAVICEIFTYIFTMGSVYDCLNSCHNVTFTFFCMLFSGLKNLFALETSKKTFATPHCAQNAISNHKHLSKRKRIKK